MPEISDAGLAALIGLATGMILGLASRIGRFCSLAAIEDATYGGNDNRLRMWGIALGVAILGSHLLMSAGLLDPADVYYLSTWSISGRLRAGCCSASAWRWPAIAASARWRGSAAGTSGPALWW